MILNGQVKWFNAKRGYGFIVTSTGEEIFVHHSQIKSEKRFKSLNPGDRVTFEKKQGPKGVYAAGVSLD